MGKMDERVWEIQVSSYEIKKSQEKEAQHKEHSQWYCNSDVNRVDGNYTVWT